MASSATILFDGVCNLCNGAVQFVIARDPGAYFRFAPLSSPVAMTILKGAGAELPLPDSMALVEDGHVYLRSDAALRIARRLTLPWPLFSLFRVVPRTLRDRCYDFLAAHRYKWFGRRESCMVPTPALRERFLS